MTLDEALAWLQQVDGRLYRSRPHAAQGNRPARTRESWVAVVRTPQRGAQRGKLIVALGESMLEATRAAAEQWQLLFDSLGPRH